MSEAQRPVTPRSPTRSAFKLLEPVFYDALETPLGETPSSVVSDDGMSAESRSRSPSPPPTPHAPGMVAGGGDTRKSAYHAHIIRQPSAQLLSNHDLAEIRRLSEQIATTICRYFDRTAHRDSRSGSGLKRMSPGLSDSGAPSGGVYDRIHAKLRLVFRCNDYHVDRNLLSLIISVIFTKVAVLVEAKRGSSSTTFFVSLVEVWFARPLARYLRLFKRRKQSLLRRASLHSAKDEEPATVSQKSSIASATGLLKHIEETVELNIHPVLKAEHLITPSLLRVLDDVMDAFVGLMAKHALPLNQADIPELVDVVNDIISSSYAPAQFEESDEEEDVETDFEYEDRRETGDDMLRKREAVRKLRSDSYNPPVPP